MSFPAWEAVILDALEEHDEICPPRMRLEQEYFWLAAAAMHSRGLVVADQSAGVVRRVPEERR